MSGSFTYFYHQRSTSILLRVTFRNKKKKRGGGGRDHWNLIQWEKPGSYLCAKKIITDNGLSNQIKSTRNGCGKEFHYLREEKILGRGLSPTLSVPLLNVSSASETVPAKPPLK